MLSFYIRQYFDRDDEDKDLNKDTLSGYWAREEEYLQMFTDMNSSSQIDFSSFKSANIPYGFQKLCQKSSKTHWQIFSRFKIHRRAGLKSTAGRISREKEWIWGFCSKTIFLPDCKIGGKGCRLQKEIDKSGQFEPLLFAKYLTNNSLARSSLSSIWSWQSAKISPEQGKKKRQRRLHDDSSPQTWLQQWSKSPPPGASGKSWLHHRAINYLLCHNHKSISRKRAFPG